MKEHTLRSLPGIPVVLAQLLILAGCGWLIATGDGPLPVLAVLSGALAPGDLARYARQGDRAAHS